MRTFERVVLIFILCCFSSLRSAESDSIHFYISPYGNDDWSGQLASPAPEADDGPFATIQRARDAVRDLKQSEKFNAPVTVFLRSGHYGLIEPIVFEPHDSGAPSKKITYRAYPGEQPVISGGHRLQNWNHIRDNRWECEVPWVSQDRIFQQLFINGKRRFRARTPNKGYYRVRENVGLPSGASYNTPQGKFKFYPGDIIAGWQNLNDVEVVVLHFWVDTHLPIDSVNIQDQIVHFAKQSRRRFTDDFSQEGARYYVDNVYAGMDQPGEWYLDQDTGMLTYLAKEGENLNQAEVFAPDADQLFIFQGEPGGPFVQHIQFRGLTFKHTDWQLPPDDAGDHQAADTVPAALHFIGSRNIDVTDCRFENMGTCAVEVIDGCRHIRITHNKIKDLAGGGIKISGGRAGSDSVLHTSHITVADNTIGELGRLYHSSVGILLRHASDNNITHNEIYDLYYTGISVGWEWGYKPSAAYNNHITYNHIHHVGQDLLSDMGGVYLLGISPGTIVRNNLIHDISSHGYGGWGIYTDEGSTDILIEDNVVYNTKSAGFHQHYGKENVIQNNIFAFGRTAQIMRTRAEDHLSFTFRRNIVYWKDAPLLGKNWEGSMYKLDYNLYYRADDSPVSFDGMSFEEWQESGQDVHSKIAKPHFMAPQHYNFELSPTSTAFDLGFEPVDLTTVGPREWPGEVQDIEYPSSADNSLQPALFYSSDSDSAKPLLVGLHTWSSDYRQKSSVPYAKWCIHKDWVFIHPNIRGPNRTPKATGSDLVFEDILSAVDYASARAEVDESRIYIIGTSGGGYAGLLMAGRAPQKWRAISSWVPISDLREWYYQSKDMGTKYHKELIQSCGGPPEASDSVLNQYKRRSPITYLPNASELALDINAGIHDGHTGSVPVSHSLRAFNAVADAADQVAEEHILYMVENEDVPPALQETTYDPFYNEKNVLFRRQSGKARVTIFDGGHEIIPHAALSWLARQR